MDWSALYSILQKLTSRNITKTEIAKILETTQQNINKKIISKSEVTVSDLLKIENHFDIAILPRRKSTFLKRKEPLKIDFNNWGLNFEEIPAANKMTLARFSKDLNIDYDKLTNFVFNNTKPTIEDISIIVSNYDVTFEDLFCAKNNDECN